MSKRHVNDVSQNSGDSPSNLEMPEEIPEVFMEPEDEVEMPEEFMEPDDELAFRNNAFIFNEVLINEVERELINQEFNFPDFPRFSLGLAKLFKGVSVANVSLFQGYFSPN